MSIQLNINFFPSAYDLPRHGLLGGFTLPGIDSHLWNWPQSLISLIIINFYGKAQIC